MKKIEERKYFVNFEITSTVCNAFITLKESCTNNEVHAVCYPNCTTVSYIKIDGIEYQIKHNEYLINCETNRQIKSKEKIEYLKSIANYIIKQGNEYLRNTFGNIEKEVVEIF